MSQANVADVQIPSGANYQTAAFRLWCPAGHEPLKGILVLVPGSNGDGRPAVNDEVWQAFATQQRLALLGCCFTDKPHPNMNIEAYAMASHGSGQALLDAIPQLASQIARPEIGQLPLLLWGHSAGGQFNYEFACAYPGRVLTFIVNKGGYYFTHLAPEPTRQIPGLFFIGERDDDFRRWSIQGIFAVNRQAGARWALATEPAAGHEEGQTRELALAWFQSLLENPAPTDAQLGHLSTKDIHPASQPSPKPDQQLTSWLPDHTFARRWQTFTKGE
jgi:pimeloyl-ACP methyl ester carboxylesterase